jgi:hypothetical protein
LTSASRKSDREKGCTELAGRRKEEREERERREREERVGKSAEISLSGLKV